MIHLENCICHLCLEPNISDDDAETYDTPPSLEALAEENGRLQNTLSLIRPFCAVNDIEETLRAPFTVGAHTYASN